jgi:predicted N-acetyltransferase YhbS
MLAVAPAQQGERLGRLMRTAAEEHGRNRARKQMDISAFRLRLKLLPFYRNLGYSETGTEEFQPSRPLKDGVKMPLSCNVKAALTAAAAGRSLPRSACLVIIKLVERE